MTEREALKTAAEEFISLHGEEYANCTNAYSGTQRALRELNLDPANPEDLERAFSFALKMSWCRLKLPANDIKIVIKKPAAAQAPDPAKTAAEAEAKRLANQKVAKRILDPLASDAFELTCRKFPSLEEAFNGDFSEDLPRDIRPVVPERKERFAGVDIELSAHRARVDVANTERRNMAARETNRGVANAQRGSSPSSTTRTNLGEE